LVAVTVQLPSPVPVNVLPEIEQLLPPEATAKVTAPLPDPPLEERVDVPL
jgi:hypothetical protein